MLWCCCMTASYYSFCSQITRHWTLRPALKPSLRREMSWRRCWLTLVSVKIKLHQAITKSFAVHLSHLTTWAAEKIDMQPCYVLLSQPTTRALETMSALCVVWCKGKKSDLIDKKNYLTQISSSSSVKVVWILLWMIDNYLYYSYGKNPNIDC